MKFVIPLLLFFVFSYLFRSDLSFDQDLGRHIKLGEIILKAHFVPKTNLFSYTNPDFSFINTHWLFEALAYLGSISIGIQGMLIFKVILFIVSVWITLKIIPKQNQVLLLPIGFIFLHVLRERLELRPEIFSFLFTALTLYILEKYIRQISHDRGTFVALFNLPLIQLIWINTHIYFFVGLVLQGIFLIHLGYQYLRGHPGGGKLKYLSIIFVLSALVSLLNPSGINGLLYPLKVTSNYGYTIVENQTMFLLENIKFTDPNFLFVKLSIGLVLLSIVIVILNVVKNISFASAQDDRLKNILLSLSGVVLALTNVRSFPYLVFLSLPAVLQNFGAIRNSGLTKFLTIITVPILLLEAFFYLNGDYDKYTENGHQPILYPVQSVKGGMDFLMGKDLPNPVYNNFDIGSYIIYRGYPKYHVFVDGRPEAYPASFFTDIYIPSQYDYNKFKDLEKKYNFKTIIFSITDQTPWGKNFLANVVKDKDWDIVYIDDFTIILVRKEVGEEKKLEALDLSKLLPGQYNFTNHLSYLRLGIFLLSEGYTNSGKQFIEKTLQIFPNDPITNSIIGNPTPNPFFW